jgi:hypothetical protein
LSGSLKKKRKPDINVKAEKDLNAAAELIIVLEMMQQV